MHSTSLLINSGLVHAFMLGNSAISNSLFNIEMIHAESVFPLKISLYNSPTKILLHLVIQYNIFSVALQIKHLGGAQQVLTQEHHDQ